ncbi:precorrin-2 dehydrogenase/sirohydrochlorin ferrochelatase family protein [Caldivirga maquilingensis]|uniref:precorrin-2 dehydrogenase n=1 Tax=Caldivirga maquilingensis (strain ATCC 700844 / DSM 13496 / JCM 10307 / IC-167) TaxID=397948 RepID=A8MAH7_CALMQ|nr:NAD(P)-dependent oxidoreductase [Caldivirga maquilingensis]ABW02554.1 siroheme synthase [Caldivirga maquilingensis IC-167]
MARVPLFVEFSDKRVLVIGGGYVGTRRALKFSEAGAYVTVIALKPSSELIKANSTGNIDLIIADAGMFDYSRVMNIINLLIYAIPTNTELKNRLKGMIKDRRVLFNDTTNANETEVVVPFEGEVNGVRFAVTTEGKSGVAASIVRDYLQAELAKSDLHPLINAWYEAKELIKKRVNDPHVRMNIYFELKYDENFIELARKGDVGNVVKYVNEVIRSHGY